jgi:ATP-dependent DNA helicase RecG
VRPSLLDRYFASVAAIRGIGPRLAKLLALLLRPNAEGKDAEARIVDLLFHLPSGLVDRSYRPVIAELPAHGVVTVLVTVGRHRPPPPHNPRAPYRVECYDDTGSLLLVFFHAYPDHLRKALPEGSERYVSGAIDWWGGLPQMVHPDHIVAPEAFAALPRIEPIYPAIAGLSQKVLGRAVRAALDLAPPLPEWHDPALLAHHGWPSFRAALDLCHRPQGPQALDLSSPPRMRLAYDELLSGQLALSLVRRDMKRHRGRPIRGTGDKRAAIISRLPYSLTPSQQAAVADILRDMASGERMLRLLQGDVGAGKTVVALMALATAAEAGAQAAFMVPTDILARQHLATIKPLAAAAGIEVALLTGREKGRHRDDILDRLKAHRIDILIGTHALFQAGVDFADLALVVIDEQHRFGVHQRLAVQAKSGGHAHVLVMTATPIPRTLTLTIYGDMDVSRLTEKPAGRQRIDTRALPLERLSEVVDGIARALAAGARVFWVCPLVEETDVIDLTAAEQRFAALEGRFPGRVGLVHGRMRGGEKDATMARFQRGDIAILVATTVIEVGVDVPEATVMVIENAERFGLAQLHQLRGRIGRGDRRSTCLLLYQGPLGETARTRLSTLRETDDGFLIAEEDLRLRGAGEVLGTRQSGLPGFRLADPLVHADLLAVARKDSEALLRHDPLLTSPRGETLKLLLYLFGRDDAVRLLSAG